MVDQYATHVRPTRGMKRIVECCDKKEKKERKEKNSITIERQIFFSEYRISSAHCAIVLITFCLVCKICGV